MKIKGMKKLAKKVIRLQDPSELKGEVYAAAIHIEGKVKEYPPSTEANMPRTEVGPSGNARVLPWYERGYGVRYIGGGGNPVSEDLINRWSIRRRNRGFTAVIGNNASYAVFVHSYAKQARFHGRRGWKTDKQVLEQERDHILVRFRESIRRELEK